MCSIVSCFIYVRTFVLAHHIILNVFVVNLYYMSIEFATETLTDTLKHYDL